MFVRYRNLFRYRYLFGLLFTFLTGLFIKNLVDYIQEPNHYLAAFLPGIRPDYLLTRLSGIEFLIIDFTLLSLLLVFSFIALSFWYDKKTAQQKKRKTETSNSVTPIIIGYVYQDLLFIKDSLIKDMDGLKKNLADFKALEVFFITMVHFQELVSEDLSERLNKLCLELNVNKGTELFLRSIKDGDVILGLRVVRTLKSVELLPVVNHYVHSKNPILRIEAIMTKLSITMHTDPDELFSSHPHFSPMDINRILPLLRKQLNTLDNLRPFLESDHSRINAIGVILLKEKGDLKFKKLIKALLSKNDPYLRALTWEYMTALGTKEDLPFLMDQYWKELPENKQKILASMSQYPPSKDLTHFLDSIVRQEETVYKVLALEALFNQNTDRFLHYLNDPDPLIERACDEVINLVN